jgi:uncharacterized protein (DUF983 family)
VTDPGAWAGVAPRLRHALRARCPRCGRKDVWARWGQLRDRCPGCGLVFLREHGYWVGGLIINIGLAEVLLIVLLLGTVATTWPDVPWTGLLIATVAAMIVVPAWFYPRTKTVWLWLDLRVHPYGGRGWSDHTDTSRDGGS